ncbi:MAG TPA: hypothetical protein VK081_03175 [Planctomycetota bacterium]|nr:hypothetical protein [Planctomycetota bacterium]
MSSPAIRRARDRIKVDPNPAIEGQPVTITVTGPGPWFIAGDPDGEIREYQPGPNNEIELTAPPGRGGGTFTITDGNGTSARIDIESSD